MLSTSDQERLDGYQKHVLQVLGIINERITVMALNLVNLQAAAAQLEADNATLIGLVQQLLAANPDSGVQAQLDAITAGLTASDTSVAAEIAALSPTGATGPSGATGSTGATGVSGATGS
jgi:hypothetical protein